MASVGTTEHLYGRIPFLLPTAGAGNHAHIPQALHRVRQHVGRPQPVDPRRVGGAFRVVHRQTPDFDTESQVTVQFDAVAGVTNSGSDDKVYLFVYQPDTGQSVLSTPVKRSERSITVAVPSEWSGMRVHLYGFVVGATESKEMNTFCMVSPTTYVGTGDIG